MSRRRTVACAAVLLLAWIDLQADCPERVAHLPGYVSAVAVVGGYAYVGGANSFWIADVSDPSAPLVVGEVVALSHGVEDIAVSGEYAYVGTFNRLHVFDISDPSAPVEVGSTGFGVPFHSPRAVAVSGGYAYVAVWGVGLSVIDVRTPSAPVEVGFLETPGSPSDVAVSDGYAYVADSSSGLRVIDISTPSSPVEVGFIDTGGDALSVAVSGEYAYVGVPYLLYGDAGLIELIDVSRPSAPVMVSYVYTASGISDVTVDAGFVFLPWGRSYSDRGGLRIIDVRNPFTPEQVGVLDALGRAWDIAVEGGIAYVAGSHGLRVIDVSDQWAPAEVGLPGAAGGVFAGSVAVLGSFGYVAGEEWGIKVIDVSRPTTPLVVGLLDAPYWTVSVAVSGSYAYVTWSDYHSGGLRVIDVSDPAAPAEVGSVDVPNPYAVALSGGYAYVTWNHLGGGLSVIDVSDPSAPVEVGSIDTPQYAVDVAVAGDYAYVTWGDWGSSTGGLRVIDVSRPSAPVEVGFVETPGYAAAVAVAGDYAYVADNDAGLRVIDVSSPSAPVEVGFADTPDYAWDVAAAGDYAYVAWGNWGPRTGGLRVIDVSRPTEPVEVGNDSAALSSAVAVADGIVILAGDGLYIYSECGSLGDPRESYIPAAAYAAGAEGSHFQTDVEINNTGAEDAQVVFKWLPRGEDNSEPVESEPITLAPGQSLRYENVLAELLGLVPDSLGALKLVASTPSVIGMSRTYNLPAGEAAGSFGQGLPAIRAVEMIQGTELRRMLFLSENGDFRANVGCVNGTDRPLRVNIWVFDDEGSFLEAKAMDLGPYSDNQVNRVFRDWSPVDGYVDVWADRGDALYTCYGSLLDNMTSDPTTILPQVPSDERTFIPAAALSAGLEGSFFQTDVELNNVGSNDVTYELLWLPRGADNSEPIHSEGFSLASGAGVRYANVLDAVFGLAADQVGGLAVEASGEDLLAMSRTYNLPSAKVAGTFGQELPGIPAGRMIRSGVKKRILFMSENDDVRSNVACQNGSRQTVRVLIELFNAEGELLKTRTMFLAPWSNNQITRVFRDHAPIEAGYVDVWTTTAGASIACYGSVLDNVTNDPTTVLPQ